MQGPVYGLSTDQADMHTDLLPNFHYDDIFGTVVNRFLEQSVAGIPLTVYGGGGQTRGYLNLKDTLQCVALASNNPAKKGELKIYNQLTETFSVAELANKIQTVASEMGFTTEIKPIDNPRRELEEHYYNPTHSGLTELGLEPHLMTNDVLAQMLEKIAAASDSIKKERILPRVSWK